MTQYKEIRDFRGYTEHWYRTDNSFTYNFTEYERDEYNGRCYRLSPSENLHDPNMDGALVRRRISKAEYESLLESCKAVCEIKEETEEERRYRIMEQHREFTRRGMYYEAYNLLLLLRKGRVKLGIGDADNNVEQFLESIGCPVRYGRNYWTATFRI